MRPFEADVPTEAAEAAAGLIARWHSSIDLPRASRRGSGRPSSTTFEETRPDRNVARAAARNKLRPLSWPTALVMDPAKASRHKRTSEIMVKHGGDIVGEVLARRGVRHLFTLGGGHISPILLGAKRQGIQVIDMRSSRPTPLHASLATSGSRRSRRGPGSPTRSRPSRTPRWQSLPSSSLAAEPRSMMHLFGGSPGGEQP